MQLIVRNKEKIDYLTTISIYFNFSLGLVIILLISLGFFTSCKKFVEVGVPVTQIVTTSVFNNDNSATAAQLVVYSKMASEPDFINKITALSSDELYTYSSNQSYKDLYANALLVTDVSQINEWGSGYTYIYYENAILENLQISNGISAKVKQQLIGEAVFMRAYWYFYLTNLYGDVPLILTTDYKTNTSIARTPQAQVYQQVIADLKKAQALLSPNYVDATDTAITVDRVRPTSWAASALLSRAYLYTGKYDSAEAMASMVINNPTYSLSPLSGPNSVFRKNSAEAIWQIIPLSTAAYTPEGSDFIILTAPPPTGSLAGSSTISSQLLNAFESGDQRRSNWIGTITDSKTGIVYNFASKYKTPNTTPTSTPVSEYSMILRLGELFLIRAEAKDQQNNPGGAIDDLNAIRIRAGLIGLDRNLSQAQVLTAVAHERQVELFTEGHRWFDLKRTKTVDNVMSAVTAQKGGAWQSRQQLYPIPLESVTNGLNIKQNDGY